MVEKGKTIPAWAFSVEWENHCRNCVHNTSDYWCNKYQACPCMALNFCNADKFCFEERKQED